MCIRNWATFISCPVNWSRMVGQEGLQWGQGQLSTRWTGHPFRGALLALWLSWRLLSQQCSARGSEVPFTWTSVQWLQTETQVGSLGVWPTQVTASLPLEAGLHLSSHHTAGTESLRRKPFIQSQGRQVAGKGVGAADVRSKGTDTGCPQAWRH